jgi:hypothetical protein
LTLVRHKKHASTYFIDRQTGMSKPFVPPIVTHNLHTNPDLQRSLSSPRLQPGAWSPKQIQSKNEKRKSLVGTLFGSIVLPSPRSPKNRNFTPPSPRSQSLTPRATATPITPRRLNFNGSPTSSPIASPRGVFQKTCLVSEAFDIAKESNRFVVIVFLRDGQDDNTRSYVENLNNILTKVRDLGGEIIVTTSLKKHNLPCGEDGQVTLIRDANNILAKLFNIPVTKLSTKEKVLKFSHRLRTGPVHSGSPSDIIEPHEELNPGIVIIRQDNVLYKWTGEQHVQRQGKKKVEPVDILRVLTYYFECEDERESVKKFVSENSVQVLDALLKSHRKRMAFARFLEREVCQEALQFMEKVEEIDNIMFYGRTDLDLDIVMRDVFNTFVKESSEMEVNIPVGIKRELTKLFTQESIQVKENPFKTAYTQVKRELRQGAFMRYIDTDEFMRDGADLVAQFSVVRKESSSCGALNLMRL